MSLPDVPKRGKMLTSSVAGLFPGYFALVMATGIVSIATNLMGMHLIAMTLLLINITAYAVLSILTIARLILFRAQLLADLTNHARCVTFLTTVAGTMVLGSQFALLTPYMWVAEILWGVGVVLWVLLIYTFFTVITLREQKPLFEESISGAWLLATVSTESISVLGTLIAQTSGTSELIYFVSLCTYLLGAMFYIVFIALIIYRWCFFSLKADKLTPPYWINMGALAITTLAGSRLLLSADHWPFLQELGVFIKGFTLFFWVTGAWWIPLLLIVGIWRHLFERVPIVYDPQYWSLVFPLGMFTVSTYMFSKATGLQFLMPIPALMVFVSLVAWALTFIGMVRQLTGFVARRV